MIIIIKDFTYKGMHYERAEFHMTSVTKLDEMLEGKLEAYMKESLDLDE